VKRLVAFVAAVALVVGGFVVYNRRTDPERGRAPLVLWCVPDAAAACEAVASSRVLVTVKTPLAMETALSTDTTVDAIVTSLAWLERADDRAKLRVSAPLASTPIVVAIRAGTNGCRDLPCLTRPATKAALPPRATLAASIVGAGVFAGKAEDELSTNLVDLLRRGGPSTNGVDALTALVTVRLVDAVVTTKPATANVAGVTVQPVTPAASLGLSIGWVRDDPRLDDLGKSLRSTFTDQGWDDPQRNVPGPDSTAVVDAYGILNR
jgi:hypothetical protein